MLYEKNENLEKNCFKWEDILKSIHKNHSRFFLTNDFFLNVFFSWLLNTRLIEKSLKINI